MTYDPTTGMPINDDQRPPDNGTTDATNQLLKALMNGTNANPNGSGAMGVLNQLLRTYMGSQMQGTPSPQDGMAPSGAGGGVY